MGRVSNSRFSNFSLPFNFAYLLLKKKPNYNVRSLFDTHIFPDTRNFYFLPPLSLYYSNSLRLPFPLLISNSPLSSERNKGNFSTFTYFPQISSSPFHPSFLFFFPSNKFIYQDISVVINRFDVLG